MLITALALCWSALVLAVYVPGHPSLFHVEWLWRVVVPPCPPWRAPFLMEGGMAALGAGLVLGAANAGWWAAGRSTARWLRAGMMHSGWGVVRLLLGITVAASGWLALGLMGLWHPAVAGAVCAGSLLTIRPGGAARPLAAARSFIWSPGAWGLMVLCLPVTWVTLAGALAPETEFDPLRYHLGLADHYVRIHRVVFREWFIFASFPLDATMLFGGLKLLGGDRAAKLLNWELLGLLARQAWLLAGRPSTGPTRSEWVTARGSSDFSRARWTVLALLAVPLVWVHATMGFAELLMANAVGAALLVRLHSRSAAGAATSGVLAGLALGTKYQAVQGVIPLAVAWAWPTPRRSVRTPWCFIAAAAVTGAAWGVKNWWFTGNPVHPLLSGVLPDIEDASRALARSRFSAGDVLGGRGVLAWLAAPWTVLVRGDRPATYPFGPVVMLLFPWAVLALRRHPLARFAAGFVVLWALTTAGWNRYLIAALPAFMAAGVATMPAGAARLGLAAAVLAGHMLGALTIYQRQNPTALFAGCEDPTTYLTTRAPYRARAMHEAGRRLAAGERYYAYGELVTYYAAREGIADYESDTPLIQRVVQGAGTPEDLRKKLRQRGIAAILHNAPGGVTASAVADMRPWTARDVRLYQEFFRQFAAVEWRLEEEGANEYLTWYRLRWAADPRARLSPGRAWPHLPALESVLAPGDALYRRGDRMGALQAYETACDAYPGYVWAHQRVAAVAREAGRTAEAARAAAVVRRLGG